VAPEHRRANERTALEAELAGVGVHPILEEPTALGLLVMGGLNERHRRWLRERFGSGWFERPTVIVCMGLEDKRVPYAVERLRRLGTVREVHTQGPRLTQNGVSGLLSGLPGVDVVPSANPALHRYFSDQVEHEHHDGTSVRLAALLALGLLLLVNIPTDFWPYSGLRAYMLRWAIPVAKAKGPPWLVTP
jgi:hypothetical protein